MVGVQKWWVSGSGGCPAVVGVQKWWVSSSGGCPEVVGVRQWWVSSSGGCPAVSTSQNLTYPVTKVTCMHPDSCDMHPVIIIITRRCPEGRAGGQNTMWCCFANPLTHTIGKQMQFC